MNLVYRWCSMTSGISQKWQAFSAWRCSSGWWGGNPSDRIFKWHVSRSTSWTESVRGVRSTPILGNLVMVWMVDQHLEGEELGNRWQVSLGKSMCEDIQECAGNVETGAAQVNARPRALVEDGVLHDQVWRVPCLTDVGSVFAFSSSRSAGSGQSNRC